MCVICRGYRVHHVSSSVIMVCVCVPVSFHLCACLPCAFSRLIPSVLADLFLSSSFVLSSFDPLQFPLPVCETKTQWRWYSGGGVIIYLNHSIDFVSLVFDVPVRCTMPT